MSRYVVIKEDALNAYILDNKENNIVALCTSKRPDLNFEKLESLVKEANREEKTNIKIIKEMDIQIINEELENEENSYWSLSVLECTTCHWTFIGDVDRYGYGYTSESQDTPDYCPMCGRKIEELIE